MTKCIMNTLNPVWEEEFDYIVPLEWGLEELVGIRALIYDADGPYRSFIGSDDFLGGCDIDMSSQKHGRMMNHELDLGGIPNSKSKKTRKPRLEIVVTCYLEVIPKPLHPSMQLQSAMQSVEYVREIVGMVVKATDLPNMDLRGHSDPQCIVRVLMMSGELVEVARTKTVMDTGNPVWSEEFSMKFDITDQPLLAIFDVFDEDDPDEPVEHNGEHLGSAIVPLLACLAPAPRSRKLLLQGETQRHETRHNAYGAPLLDVFKNEGQLRASGRGRDPQPDSPIDDSQRIKDKQKRKQDKYLALQYGVDAAPKESKISETLARIGTGLRNWIRGAIETPGQPLLHLELRARTKTDAMPFTELLTNPRSIADEDDCESMLAHPGWQRTLYSVPPELQDEELKPTYRGLMVAKDHIAFIYGVVHGAMALPKPDGPDGNKVDAYCLVHAMTPTGEKAFIHRTRVIKNTQNPAWEEAFYFAVPEDLFVSRLQLSVYTRPVDTKSVLAAGAAQSTTSVLDLFSRRSTAEQEQILLDDMRDANRDDIFLGRAGLDLAYAISGAMTETEVQLMGAAVPEQEKISSGFRRTRSISFEAVIERRYRPCYTEDKTEHFASMDRRQHHLTRHPDPRRPFNDLAITLPDISHAEELASQAMELASTSSFLHTKKQRHRHNWVKLPRGTAPETLSAQERFELEKEAENKTKRMQQMRAEQDMKKRIKWQQGDQHLDPGSDFTIRKPVQKSSSLPALATNFGKIAQENYNKRVEARDVAAPKGVTSGTQTRLPRWKAQQVSSCDPEDPKEFMHQKPNPFDLITPRPPYLSQDLYSTAPARRFR